MILSSFSASGQNIQHTEKAVDLGLRGDLKVNPATHALELQLPLKTYPGRAGSSLPIQLYYSSRVWRVAFSGYVPNGGDPYTTTSAVFAGNSKAGWTSSLGVPYIDPNVGNEWYGSDGNPVPSCQQPNCFVVDRISIQMPDGSAHEFRSTDVPYAQGTSPSLPDVMVAVDGSQLRYKKSTRELFLPDGSRYVLGDATTRFVDRNGNTLTYTSATGQWTDTLGRTINAPPLGVSAPGDYAYTLPGVNGTPVTYTFRWRYLEEVRTVPDQGSYYVAASDCGPNTRHNPYSPALFTSAGNTYVCGPNVFNPVVLHQIVLPTGQAYTFTYNVYGEIDKVVYPTGGYERYQYGHVDAASWFSPPYSDANRGVVNRFVSASGSGGDEVRWQYPVPTTFQYGQFHQSEVTPDGTRTDRFMYRTLDRRWGYGDSRGAVPYDVRVYNSSGVMIRRSLTGWTQDGPSPSCTSQSDAWCEATRNPRVTRNVEILLDTGGSSLAKTTIYDYDQDLNRTSVTEHDFVAVDQTTAQSAGIEAIPAGSALRTTENTFLVNDPDVDSNTRAAYRARHLVSLPTSTRVHVGDGSGAAVSQTRIRYDESAYPLVAYGPVTGWTDPGTTVRGNATTSGSWLDTAGAWVEAHFQYDQAGSVVNSWDAKWNLTQTAYSSTYAYSYPTSVTSPAPDPNNTGYGSTTGLVTTTAYDFSTGFVTSTTDANGQTTTFEYSDPLNRLKKINRPDGGSTSYFYDRSTNAGLTSDYIRTVTALDSSRSVESYQFFDGLGRPARTFLNEGGSPAVFLTADMQYDAAGRAWRVSSPYRTGGSGDAINPSNRWTTTGYDALGRATSVTTPDGAAVTTAYAGNAVTVTDQAGRKRRSVTDALGRLARVDEPDAAGGLLDDAQGNPVQPTSYAYDALGNLRRVEQGGQQRFFMYDSLGRLVRAKNPEQAANAGLTLADPVTGNSQWSMGYGYDANGNLTSRVDARGVTTAYAYDGLNRNTLVSYSDATPGVRRVYDSAVNGLGRYRADWTWDGSSTYYTHRAVDNYDAMGRPLDSRQYFYVNNAVGAAFTTGLTYNLAGAVTSQTYPSGHKVGYGYDAMGRLGDDGPQPAFAGSLGGEQRTYSSEVLYDQSGGMSQERLGTDTPLYHKRHYNSRGQLYDIRLSTVALAADRWNWNRGAIINYYSSNYAWEGDPSTPPSADNNGNLLRQQVWVPSDDAISSYVYTQQTFAYDSLNRLKSLAEARGTPSGQGGQELAQGYDYDRWGNRTINAAGTWAGQPSNPPNNELVNERQFDGGDLQNTNRLYAPGDTALPMNQRLMRYDAAGNLTYDAYTGAGARTFDAENRMVSAQTGSSQGAAYAYDADGRRVKRLAGTAGEVWQVYGLVGELLAEYAKGASPAQPRKEYGYRGGELLVTAEVAGGWGAAPTFTDERLAGKVVQSLYVVELRQAIDALRAHKGLAGYQWASTVGHGDPVTAASFAELRTALDQALGAPAGGYTAGLASGQPIRAVFLEELRRRVLEAWQGGSGGADIRWLVADQLGTPRMVVDRTGSLAGVTRHDYLPFGEELYGGTGGRTSGQGYGAADNVRQKFTEKERDNETSLDFFVTRYYAPAQGRFTSPDEVLVDQNPANPQSWNLYAYVGNSPLNYIDPLGLWKAIPCGNGGTCYQWENEKDTWESLAQLLKVEVGQLTKFFVNTTLGEGVVLDTDNFERNHFKSDPLDIVEWTPIDQYLYDRNRWIADFEGSFNEVASQYEDGPPVMSGGIRIRPAGRGGASAALARNIENSGVRRPRNTAAHHIVAFGAKRAAAARAVLSRYGIDINAAENGVFLRTGAHRGVHTHTYYDRVNELLSQAGSREEALQVLRYIRNGLLSGTFP